MRRGNAFRNGTKIGFTYPSIATWDCGQSAFLPLARSATIVNPPMDTRLYGYFLAEWCLMCVLLPLLIHRKETSKNPLPEVGNGFLRPLALAGPRNPQKTNAAGLKLRFYFMLERSTSLANASLALIDFGCNDYSYITPLPQVIDQSHPKMFWGSWIASILWIGKLMLVILPGQRSCGFQSTYFKKWHPIRTVCFPCWFFDFFWSYILLNIYSSHHTIYVWYLRFSCYSAEISCSRGSSGLLCINAIFVPELCTVALRSSGF